MSQIRKVWLVRVVGVVLVYGLRGGVDGDHVPVPCRVSINVWRPRIHIRYGDAFLAPSMGCRPTVNCHLVSSYIGNRQLSILNQHIGV